jgi:hypothetical protein
MTTTGGFHAVVQIDQSALQRIATAMHRAGPAEHVGLHTTATTLIELLFNAPALALDSLGPPGEIRARSTSRVLYHERPLSAPADLGINAVCDVAVRTTLRLAGGDPAPVSINTNIEEDWTATTANDIVVHAAAAGSTIQSNVLDFIHQHRGLLELDFLAGAGISQMGMRVLDRGSRTPVAAIGLNFSPVVGTTSANLVTSFCQTDWALAISTDYLVGLMIAQLDGELGGLPPPHGGAPVLLQDDGTERVFLDEFVIVPSNGSILLSGVVRRVGPGPFGTVTANWTSTVTLSLGQGQTIVATASQPAVQLNEWYAVVGNWITGQRIERIVSGNIAAQLSGGVGNLGANTFLANTIGRIATAGLTRNVPIDVRAINIDTQPDAVIVHGSVGFSTPLPGPQAQVVALQRSTPAEILFHAGASWCPGGEISSIDWEFGDGSSQHQSGTNLTFVVSHTYIPGQYAGCVTITDGQGRTARACVGVQPGSLMLELIDHPQWEFCATQPDLQFRVSSSGSPVAGATITLAGIGWQLTAVTDRMGRAAIVVDAKTVQNQGLSLPKPSPYHLGVVSVTASKSSWVQRQTNLWMVDCDALLAARLGAATLRQEFIDRLAGYATLREIRKQLGREPDVEGILRGTGLPDPRTISERQISDTFDLLTRLEDHLRTGSSAGPVATILGINPDERDVAKRVQQRLGELWRDLDRSADEHEQRYGPGRDPRPR